MTRVAVLFARADSVYKTLRGCDVWDEQRDARKWQGGCPVIAHPPCRAWGGLRHMAKPAPGERELAVFALAMVRKWGGVLEHPRRSELWPKFRLPMGDEVDEYGGFSLLVNQSWWGHLAEKPSLLYVCRVARADVPPIAVDMAAPSHIVGSSGRRIDGSRLGWRADLSRRLREATPRDFALWLVRLARAVVLEQHGRAELAAAGRRAARGGYRATPAEYGRLEHRRSAEHGVSQLASSTYRHRDPEARRAYMRELMRRKRTGRAQDHRRRRRRRPGSS